MREQNPALTDLDALIVRLSERPQSLRMIAAINLGETFAMIPLAEQIIAEPASAAAERGGREGEE